MTPSRRQSWRLLPLVRPSVAFLLGTSLARAAAGAGHPVVSEIFAHRAVTADGLLVSRSEPGSVLADPRAIAERIGGWLRTGHLTGATTAGRCACGPNPSDHSDTPDAVTSATYSNGGRITRCGGCALCRAGGGRAAGWVARRRRIQMSVLRRNCVHEGRDWRGHSPLRGAGIARGPANRAGRADATDAIG